MNKEEFIGLSLNPNSITNDNLISLESILEEYPYFQTAQVLHLKGLKNQRSFKYNNALKKVAAYTTNRTVLFDFITSDVLNYEEKAKSENDILLDIDVVDSNIIEHIHKSIATQDNKQVVKELIDEVEKPIETIKIEKELEIGLPINFSKNDEFSFNEWLDFTPQKQIKRKKEENKGKKTTKKAQKSNKLKLSDQVNLIENFITKKPKIETSKTQEVKDIAIESVEENTSIMTETLARVYLEQKKYDKAISAFKILSLKYPEKSSFFADRINAIKILQKHKL